MDRTAKRMGATVGSSRKRLAAVAAITVLALALSAAPASAVPPYEDEEGSNPLRVASYVMHPVGTILEWTVFRPLYFVGARLAPRQDYESQTHLDCRRRPPPRQCTDAID